MSHLRIALAKATDGPWKFFHVGNDTKVKLGVVTTIGSCIVAMLVIA
jgi:hypothetical protein